MRQGQTVVVYNTTDAGVPVDDAGHLLGGLEHGPVVKDGTTRGLLDSRVLVEVPDPGGTVSGPAGSAFDAARGPAAGDAAEPTSGKTARTSPEGR